MNSRLFKVWELNGKDKDGNELYKQASTLIHSTPQHSIEFRPNGDYLQRDIGSDGKITTRIGRFEAQDNLIIVRFPEEPYMDLILNITIKNGDILEVRK